MVSTLMMKECNTKMTCASNVDSNRPPPRAPHCSPSKRRPPWISTAIEVGLASLAGFNMGILNNKRMMQLNVPHSIYFSIFGAGSIVYTVNRGLVAYWDSQKKLQDNSPIKQQKEKDYGKSINSHILSVLSKYTYKCMKKLVEPLPATIAAFAVFYIAGANSDTWLLEAVVYSGKSVLQKGTKRSLQNMSSVGLSTRHCPQDISNYSDKFPEFVGKTIQTMADIDRGVYFPLSSKIY